MTTLLDRRAQFHQQALTSHVTQYDAAYRSMIEGTAGKLLAQGSGAAQASSQAHGVLYNMIQRQAAMLSFVDDFWLLGLIFLAVIPLMLFMKKAKPATEAVAAH